MRQLIPAIVAGLLLCACQHQTRITTSPSGARVYLDGIEIPAQVQGGREVTLPSRHGWIRQHLLRVEAPGYQPVSLVLERRYHADGSLLWLLPGVIPYLFTARLPDRLAPIRLAPARQLSLPGTGCQARMGRGSCPVTPPLATRSTRRRAAPTWDRSASRHFRPNPFEQAR